MFSTGRIERSAGRRKTTFFWLYLRDGWACAQAGCVGAKLCPVHSKDGTCLETQAGRQSMRLPRAARCPARAGRRPELAGSAVASVLSSKSATLEVVAEHIHHGNGKLFWRCPSERSWELAGNDNTRFYRRKIVSDSFAHFDRQFRA